MKQLVEKQSNIKCEYCGLENLIVNIGRKGRHKRMVTFDHLIPKFLGGTNELDNLVICCAVCNSKKGNRPPTEKELTCRRISQILST
jgi:5-methylcytosine-specific restriction endonuclease McrA